MKFTPTQPQSEIDKKIAYAQSWNLAAAAMQRVIFGGDVSMEEMEKVVEKLQEYFFKKLTEPYEQKTATKPWGTMKCPTCKNPRNKCQCDESNYASQDQVSKEREYEKADRASEEVAISAEELI